MPGNIQQVQIRLRFYFIRFFREDIVVKHFEDVHFNRARGTALLKFCSKCARVGLGLGAARTCNCSPDKEHMSSRDYMWRLRSHLGFHQGNAWRRF